MKRQGKKGSVIFKGTLCSAIRDTHETCIIVAGIYLFISFVPQHATLLSVAWVVTISYLYILYSRG